MFAHPDKPWNWNRLNIKLNITIKDIQQYSKLWDVLRLGKIERDVMISLGNSFAIKRQFRNEPELQNVFAKSINKQSITSTHSEIDKPCGWNWGWLSRNPNITMKDVNAHPDKPWDWDCLSKNPNITMKDVESHLDKPWNWGWMSENLFMHSPSMRTIAINKIQTVRAKHRNKMYAKMIYPGLGVDLIGLINHPNVIGPLRAL